MLSPVGQFQIVASKIYPYPIWCGRFVPGEKKSRGIITLCGSTKFRRQFEEVNRVLELNDWIVLTVASYYHSEKNPPLRRWIERNKKQLDELHLVKVELSQAIVVIDVDNYIGKSTRSEINHAKRLEKPVYYWSDKSWLALTR